MMRSILKQSIPRSVNAWVNASQLHDSILSCKASSFIAKWVEINLGSHVRSNTHFSKYWKYCKGLRYMNPSAFSTIIIFRVLFIHNRNYSAPKHLITLITIPTIHRNIRTLAISLSLFTSFDRFRVVAYSYCVAYENSNPKTELRFVVNICRILIGKFPFL